MKNKISFEQRIVIQPDGCHVWIGARNRNGYGCYTLDRKVWLSHRYAWTLVHGAIPAGMVICHHCDNPSCVNVNHLFIGTQTDNLLDMTKKGRRSFRPHYGENHGRAKLTETDVLRIRSLELGEIKKYTRTKAISSVAKEYGVSRGTIYKIVNGTNWATTRCP